MSRSPVTLEQPDTYFQLLDETALNHWWGASVERIERVWLKKAMEQNRRPIRKLWDWLDVGCGSGSRLRLWSGWNCWKFMHGIEPETTAIDMAQFHMDQVIEIQSGHLPGLSGISEVYDLVTAFDVIQHVPNHEREAAIRELAQKVGPGGLLLIRTNAFGLSFRKRDDSSITDAQTLRQTLLQEHFKIINSSHFNFTGGLLEDVASLARNSWQGRPDLKGPKKNGLPENWQKNRKGHWLGRILGWVESQIVASGVVKLPIGHSYIVLAIKDEHHG
jgi:2-polyprenyl-3-methyl-5-hydroxy-6-metoxy-1,4-benzoquinol methylase